jgi:hypothetical protein
MHCTSSAWKESYSKMDNRHAKEINKSLSLFADSLVPSEEYTKKAKELIQEVSYLIKIHFYSFNFIILGVHPLG